MTLELVAFLDESKKPVRNRRTGKVDRDAHYYVVASAVTFSGDLDDCRAKIAALETDLGYKLHFSGLRSHTRRVNAVDAVVDLLEGWESHLFESSVPFRATAGAEHRARAQLLEAAFTYLGNEAGVNHVVLETRAEPVSGFDQLDTRDHRVLQKLHSRSQVPAGFSISHATKHELALGLADILAGARTDFLCGKDDECYARLSHRVTRIHAVG